MTEASKRFKPGLQFPSRGRAFRRVKSFSFFFSDFGFFTFPAQDRPQAYPRPTPTPTRLRPPNRAQADPQKPAFCCRSPVLEATRRQTRVHVGQVTVQGPGQAPPEAIRAPTAPRRGAFGANPGLCSAAKNGHSAWEVPRKPCLEHDKSDEAFSSKLLRSR